MPHGMLPEHQATAPVVENNEVVNKPEAEEPKRDVAQIASDLQAQADAEAAANKAANENPELTEEQAEAIGKKHVEKALTEKKEGEADPAKTDKLAVTTDDWTPNLKYKVLDQEKEIPEWARGAITKENEADIRAVFEKADGLDHVKSKLGEERTARESVEQNFSGVKSQISNLVGWRDKNLGIFFEKVGVSKEKAAQWLLQEIEKQDLPEPVRRMYTEHEENQRRLADLEAENLQLSSARETDTVQARTNELGQVLSSPDVAQLVSAFDNRVGKPGSFQQMVIRHGHAEWEASGHKRDMSPKEAVDEVLKILNLSQAPSPVATPNETAAANATEPKQKVVQQKKPVVLPNIGSGGGSSTAAKRVKSVDDIRKVYKEMSGQNQ